MTNPIDRALERADRITAANAALEAVTAGAPSRDPIAEAVERHIGPRLNALVDEAHRMEAERKAGELRASEVLDAAAARYARVPVAHFRAQLAARIVNTQAGAALIEDLDDPAEVARLGAVVALELVERDKPTAEAKLERVRQLAARWLANTPPAAMGTDSAARAVLAALESPA